MFISNATVGLLVLIAWCKNFDANMRRYFDTDMFSQERIELILRQGYAVSCRESNTLRLRPLGYHMLELAGFVFEKDSRTRSEKNILARRKLASAIMTTFYRAGVYVFTPSLDGLGRNHTYLSAFALRRKTGEAGKAFGGTSFFGVSRMSDTAYLVIDARCREDIHIFNELKAFNRIRQLDDVPRRAVMLMGESTSDIGNVVFGAGTSRRKTRRNKVRNISRNSGSDGSYTLKEAFEEVNLPVHFIPSCDAGAYMLKLMKLPDYRERVMEALYHDQYDIPGGDKPDVDGIASGAPIIIAMDMDCKRVERALEQAESFKSATLLAFEEQGEFLKWRYGNNIGVSVRLINPDKLSALMDDGLALFEPQIAPFVTKEGGMIDVTAFGFNCTAGGKGGKEA